MVLWGAPLITGNVFMFPSDQFHRSVVPDSSTEVASSQIVQSRISSKECGQARKREREREHKWTRRAPSLWMRLLWKILWRWPRPRAFTSRCEAVLVVNVVKLKDGRTDHYTCCCVRPAPSLGRRGGKRCSRCWPFRPAHEQRTNM